MTYTINESDGDMGIILGRCTSFEGTNGVADILNNCDSNIVGVFIGAGLTREGSTASLVGPTAIVVSRVGGRSSIYTPYVAGPFLFVWSKTVIS